MSYGASPEYGEDGTMRGETRTGFWGQAERTTLVEREAQPTQQAHGPGDWGGLGLTDMPDRQTDRRFVVVVVGLRHLLSVCCCCSGTPRIRPKRGRADLLSPEISASQGFRHDPPC